MNPEPSDRFHPALEAFMAAWAENPDLDVGEYCQSLGQEQDGLREEIEDYVFVVSGLRAMGSRAGRRQSRGSLEPPERIGLYEVKRVLGEGGMGSVFLVEQQSPVRRKAALKLIKPGMDSQQVLRRFELERQSLAMMEHGNIARVFDVGADDQGRPYFVMEYVDGQPIDRYCSDAGLGLEDRVRLFIDVCAGVQHAHQKGVLHRDLKPSNILVMEQDGRPVPKIIDFGLARAMDPEIGEATLMTLAGQLLGTPEYMAPEQTWGREADVDSRIDIYSLGVILYQLLACSLPLSTEALRGSGLHEMERLIREEVFESPSLRLAHRAPVSELEEGVDPCLQWQHRLRGDLDWITMKALDKDRERRYSSAQALAEDLGRYLDHEPVLAGPPSGLYRFKKLVRKHRTLFASLAAIILVLALALGLVLRSYGDVRTALALAEEKEAESKKSSAFLQSYLQTLTDRFPIHLRGGVQSLDKRAGWREDFESKALGRFPRGDSLWTIGTDNKDVEIVDSGDPDRGRVLQLRGIPKEWSGSSVGFPVSPESLAYCPEFTLSFRFKVRKTDVGEAAAVGVALTRAPSWRVVGSHALFKLWTHGRLTTEGVPEEDLASSRSALAGIWHSYLVQYRRLDDMTAEIHAYLDNVPLSKEPLRIPVGENEDEYRWLVFNSADDVNWFDDIEVSYPLSSRPWMRNHVTGHDYMLTPRSMTWEEARHWARSRGGDLVVIDDAIEARWLLRNFYMANYWIGLKKDIGESVWSWVDGRPFQPVPWLMAGESSGVPKDRAGRAHSVLVGMDRRDSWEWGADEERKPGIVEFTSPPLTASVLWWGAGCPGSGGAHNTLKAQSPPIHGQRMRLRLSSKVAASKSFLIVGRESKARKAGRSAMAFLDLDGFGAPGCQLFPSPIWVLPARADPVSGQAHWSVPIPAGLRSVGQRLYLQALILDPGANKLGMIMSNGLLALVGHAPPGGDLIDAQSIGGDPMIGHHKTDSQHEPQDRDCLRGQDKISSVAPLSDGRYLVAGRFRKAAAFGPKFPRITRPLVLVSEGGVDGYLASYENDGRVRWARRFGGKGEEVISDLATGKDGSIYLSGTFKGSWTASLVGGGSQALLSRGRRDAFVARLTAAGEIIWIQSLGGPGDEEEPALAVDAQGHVILVGGFRERLVLGPRQEDLKSRGGVDLFLARFDGQGDRLWLQVGGGPDDDAAGDVVTCARGGIVLCGEFRGAAEFPNLFGKPLRLLARSKPETKEKRYEDIFLLRYERDGRLSWGQQAGGHGPDGATTLAIAKDGGILLGGYYKWYAHFGRDGGDMLIGNSGWTDGFCAAYTRQGEIRWLVGFKGRFYKERVLGVQPLEDGSVLVCGSFYDHLTAGRESVPSLRRPSYLMQVRGSGNEDAFVARLHPDGEVAWVRPAGGEGPDRATGITALSDGSVLVTGYCTGPATFGQSEGNQSALLLTGSFLARYYR